MVLQPVSVTSVSIHTFKHEYLLGHWASYNQILSQVSLEWGKDCIRFRNRSDQNSGFHGNRYAHRFRMVKTGPAGCHFGTSFHFPDAIERFNGVPLP